MLTFLLKYRDWFPIPAPMASHSIQYPSMDEIAVTYRSVVLFRMHS